MIQFLNYFLIGYLILKPAITNLFFNFDGAGRIPLILMVLILTLNVNNKNFYQTIISKPIITWVIWGIYVGISWYIIGIRSVEIPTWSFLFNYIIFPIFSMVVAAYESKRNYKTFSKFILYCFVSFCILGFTFQEKGNTEERGGELLGNALPLAATCMFYVASFCRTHNIITKKIFYAGFVLAILAILMVATRKALIAVSIIYILYILSQNRTVSFSYIFKIVLLFLFVLIIGNYILDNTLLGDRFRNTEDVGSEFNTTNIAWLNFLGDRAYFYITGWKLFLEEPLTGIGLMNFRVIEKTQLPIHSEYIVQLTECGLIGCFFFILFYRQIFSLIKRIKANNYQQNIKLNLISWFFAFFFLSLTTWTYQFPRYFIITGMIIGYCKTKISEK